MEISLKTGTRVVRSRTFWLLALGPVLATVALGASSGADESAPTVLALSAETRYGNLEVHVRVVDPSGPGEVLFHVRGPYDEAYRVVPMSAVEGDEFRVSVPFSGGADDWLVYYVEASDRHGNGPGLNGSAEDPFHAFPTKLESAVWREHPGTSAMLLAPSLLLLLLVLFQPGRRRREEQFWIELLAPVSAETGDALQKAIAALCSTQHHHPARGFISVEPSRAMKKLARLKTTRADQLRQACERLQRGTQQRRVATCSLANANEEQIRDHLFWFHMLQPIVDGTPAEIGQQIHRLAVRRHFHPAQGWRIFGAGTLRRRLDEVRRVDSKELFDIARHLDDPPRPEPIKASGTPSLSSSGTSLVELVVILAILGALIGITALAFKPLEAPVRVGGDLTEALMRQARARSVARTSVHRVRPLDADSLIVESSTKCSSGTWSLEQDMSLDLPRDVTISDTSWSVCFDSRGIASDNVIMAFNHPQFPSRQLEVLQGGTTRWLP